MKLRRLTGEKSLYGNEIWSKNKGMQPVVSKGSPGWNKVFFETRIHRLDFLASAEKRFHFQVPGK